MNIAYITLYVLSFLAFAAEKKIPLNEKKLTEEKTETIEEKSWEFEELNRVENIYPSNYGLAGVFRVRSAEGLPIKTITFGLGGEFYYVTNAPDFGTGATAKTLAESLFIGFSPLEKFTVAFMRRNSSTTFGEPSQLISSLGDLNFSFQYSFALTEWLSLSPILHLLVASNFNQLTPSGNTLSAGGGFAATANLYKLTGLGLAVHANLLYHMPQIRGGASVNLAPETFFQFSRFDTITFGLGGEIRLGDFIPFVEYVHTVNAGSALSLFNSPSKVTVGSRFTPLSNKSLAILLGADVGIGKGVIPGIAFSPDYQIVGQISYTVGVTQTERKHYSTTKDVNVVDRKFIVGKNINFKINRADIESNSFEILNQIADVIKKNHVQKLLIVGHTDATHTDEFNLKLSLDRANSVKSYLLSQGVDDTVFMTQGYGKRQPIASNKSYAGRALNRRVEFFVVE